jgi:hypothetical protein
LAARLHRSPDRRRRTQKITSATRGAKKIDCAVVWVSAAKIFFKFYFNNLTFAPHYVN